jgi:hypothetical protein
MSVPSKSKMTASKTSSASRPKLTATLLLFDNLFDNGITVTNKMTPRDNPLLSEHSLTKLGP